MVDSLLRREVTLTHADGSIETTRGALQQQSADEEQGQGEFSRTEWRLYLPAGVELNTAATAEVDGITYEVNGDPWEVWDEELNRPSHVEVALERTGSDVDLGGSGEEDF